MIARPDLPSSVEAHRRQCHQLCARPGPDRRVNLFLLATVINALVGWPRWLSLVVAAAVVLSYITLGGLSAAIYNEVLQFFVILAALIPLTVFGLIRVGGWNGLKDKVVDTMSDG
jgi:solute:Na+ symporter, SSS family